MSEAHFAPVSLIDGITPVGFTFSHLDPVNLHDSPRFEDAVEWCAENLGMAGSTEVRRWTHNSLSRLIFIRDRTDAAAFKLRWC